MIKTEYEQEFKKIKLKKREISFLIIFIVLRQCWKIRKLLEVTKKLVLGAGIGQLSLRCLLTIAAVRLGVLSSRGPRLDYPVSLIRLLGAQDRGLCLVGEGHDGGGGVRGGGGVLGVGEVLQVLVGCVYGAVDGTFGGAAHAVLLCLIQVVGYSSFCTGVKVIFNILFSCFLSVSPYFVTLNNSIYHHARWCFNLMRKPATAVITWRQQHKNRQSCAVSTRQVSLSCILPL